MKTKTKSFWQHRSNGFRLTFQNGNSISTIWGKNSHTENYDYKGDYNDLLESNTVEIMVDCPDKLHKKLHKKYDGDGSVIDNLTIEQWLEIIKTISKSNPLQNRK